ncbi:sensor histidine kinase [Pseudaquabacterium rugosum]|uniref:histidine kinase n=1 Tax=Pseudaquabacterium rugosum TaxID=2984194 RepID=A0ABU9B901_9BURK
MNTLPGPSSYLPATRPVAPLADSRVTIEDGPGPGPHRHDALQDLLQTALDHLRAGETVAAQTLLGTDARLSAPLEQVFRLYQLELETRNQQLEETQLRMSRTLDWFSTLFRLLPQPALLIDEHGVIVDANARATEDYALAGALRSMPLPLRRLLVQPEAERELALALLRCRDEGVSVALDDMAVLTFDRRRRWADLRLCRLPLREGLVAPGATLARRDGPPAGLFLCLFNDRTARVEAQQAHQAALRAQQEQALAEAASRAKSKLLSRLSHELRTPLNAVIGFTHLLQLQGDVCSSEGQRRLSLMRQASEHLLGLVNEVLELQRLECGALQLQEEAVPLRQTVRDVMQLQEAAATALGLRLRVAGPTPQDGTEDGAAAPDEVLARGDGRRIWEVLTNLVSNAIKYNRRDSWVEARCGRDTAAGRVWIEIADGGIGLDEAQLEHLFEPFNRLGAERTAVGGTGLGLSIARGLAEAMGGRLDARSEPGVGSCFRLTLPAA